MTTPPVISARNLRLTLGDGPAAVEILRGIDLDVASGETLALLGRPDWVQPDRIHPTAEGIDAMVAATVDAVAEALPKD